MSFEDFARVEERKAFQGKFMETDYFVRFVKNWAEAGEKYGDVCYKNSGYAKITATVTDDSEALFTPCTYKIKDCKVIDDVEVEPILEIVSFRGRFCEQAKTNERVTAQGKVERVTDTRKNREYYRMIIGNKPTDFMAVLHV
jgi:predicted nucleotidyltransferase